MAFGFQVYDDNQNLMLDSTVETWRFVEVLTAAPFLNQTKTYADIEYADMRVMPQRNSTGHTGIHRIWVEDLGAGNGCRVSAYWRSGEAGSSATLIVVMRKD